MEPPWADSGRRTDWVSCGLTFCAALLLYVLTLAPDVTLGFSGIFVTGAMYGGVPHPPGYPISTIWAWLFIHLLPFGNAAWRVGISSAVAGALACGVIAFMVSRSGAELLRERGRESQSIEAHHWPRIVSGFAAGMIFGANGAFWQRALIADSWTLSILLLCLVLCLLMCWAIRPERRRFLYAAAFLYGLTLTNSQIQLAFAPAIPFLAWACDRRLGRDLFLSGSLLFLGSLMVLAIGRTPMPLLHYDWSVTHPLFRFVVILGVIATGCGLGLSVLSGRLFTELKAVLVCVLLFLLGLSFYFYVPVASMTNPPMNWGYPRTVAGFGHVLSRGQYEGIHPTTTLPVYGKQLRSYVRVAGKEFGWPFMGIALLPLLVVPRLSVRMRRWILGLVAAFLSLTLLLLAILNPALDRQSIELNSVFFSSSYVVMSLMLGYGLLLLVRGQTPENALATQSQLA